MRLQTGLNKINLMIGDKEIKNCNTKYKKNCIYRSDSAIMHLRSSYSLENKTQVSRGTDRSSMETLLLSCLQAQLLVSKIQNHPQLSLQIKNDLIWELKQVTEKKCDIDAND